MSGWTRTSYGWAEILSAALAIACYVNVLPNDYCYDDHLIVRLSAKVNEPGHWGEIWTTDYWSRTRASHPRRDLLYRPVSLSTYRLVRTICGPGPLPQHIVNVLLHALACVLVVRLTRHVLSRRSPVRGVDPFDGRKNGLSALVAGVLFAVLPIHTEAVAAVVGRADLLATIGVLATLLAHRRLQLMQGESGRAHNTTWAWCAAAAVAAFLAMGSKEVGLMIVGLVPLFDIYWSRAETPLMSCEKRCRRWPATAARLAYLLLPLAVYLALRYHALDGRIYQSPPLTRTVNVLVGAPAWQHALGVVQLWGMYCFKTVWPDVLSIKYSINSIRLATGPVEGHVLLGAVVAVSLAAASVYSWRRGAILIAVLSGAMAISYAPTSNAVVLMRVFFAERIWYLPSVWVAILVGIALGGRCTGRVRAMSVAVILLVACGMLTRCWFRNREWRNDETLYAAAHRDQPGGVGPLHLYGNWLVSHDRFDRGITLLNRAIEIDPGFVDAHRSLGFAYARAGNLEKAAEHLQIADMQVPGHAETVEMLAQIGGQLAESDDTLAHLLEQVEDDPEDVSLEIALADRLLQIGRARDALLRFEHKEQRFGGDADWQAQFAVTLVYLDRRDRAIDHYRISLRLDDSDPQRAVELAMLLLERRGTSDLDEAWRWATRASKLAPDVPHVILCQAELLAAQGRIDSALALFDKAIRSLPQSSRQRRMFEQRARALGWRPGEP